MMGEIIISQKVKMTMKKMILSCLLALGATLASVASEKAPFVLATNGVPQAVVITAKDADATVKESARMLAEYLGKLSGSLFMISDKPVPGYKSILVGTPYKPAKREELRIRVKDANTLEVTGDGFLGIRYAVQELVEHFGVVFCSAIYEYIPEHAGLSLPGDFDRVDAPALEGRSMVPVWLVGHGSKYALKHRLNIVNKNKALKPFNATVELRFGSNPYYKKFPEHHAFTREGKRTNRYWFCPSDEALYPKLIAAVEKDIQAGQKMISLGVDDGGFQCHCDKCKKLIRVVNERYPNGRDYPSLQNLYLLNRVAKEFKDKYPDVLFTMLAYWDFYDAPPPEVCTLEPNVGIGLALLWRNFGRPVSACERAILQHDDWAKLFPKNSRGGLYIWDYYANYRTFILPFANLDTIDMNLKHYKANGVKMIDPQMQISNLGDLCDLHFWLLAKLAWNPDADYEQLLSTYLNAAYGKAAPFIREYIELLEHARDRNFAVWIGCYQPNMDFWMTGEDCVRAWSLWERAAGAVRRDLPRLRNVNESRFAAISMAIVRYNAMIEPAKKMRVKLPSREALLKQWRAIEAVGRADGRSLQFAEAHRLGGGSSIGFDGFYEELLKEPVRPTASKKTKASYVFTAKDITGGTKMEKLKDPDGTEFARISVNLSGEPERIWMNPKYAEAGVTLTKEHEGEWYVFATVRTGTTMPYDRGAAYVGIYRYTNISLLRPEAGGQMEIAHLPIVGRKDDRGWQTICLGKYPLYAKARLWLMNGILEPTEFADVKSFMLVDPTLIEGASLPLLTDSRSQILGARKLKGADRARLTIENDKIDKFEFATVANETAAKKVDFTVGPKEAGVRDVFAIVRLNSRVEFDPDAARLELFAPPEKKGGALAATPLASTVIKSEYGNASWQVVSLGRHNLAEGSVLRFSPALKPELKAADIRAFVLIKPDVLDATVPLADKVWDVVIYGSSPAAITAAIEAQKQGKEVIIISPETRIGGLTTGGLGGTDIGHKLAYGGLAMKFYQDVATYYKNPKVWKRQKREDYKAPAELRGTESMWTFEPSVALSILMRWEKENKLTILRDEKLDREPGGVLKDGTRITAFRTLSGKMIAGKMFVDATYEGDLMAAAGVSYSVGREPNSLYGETLNGIQRARAVYHQFNKGVDPYVEKGNPASGLLPGVEPDVADPDGTGDKRVQAYCFRMCLTDDPKNRIPFRRPPNYNERTYELLLRNLEALDLEAVAKKPNRFMPWINSQMPNRKTDTNNRTGVSTDFIGGNYDWAEADYLTREKIRLEHLYYQQGLMWTLSRNKRVPEPIRTEVARWGTCRDEFRDGLGYGWQTQLYVREARRMVGETVMTEAYCRHQKKATRPIAMGSYWMDSHHVRRYVGKDGFVYNEGDVEIPVEKPYGIDYGAIVPKKAECTNLFVPVCLSASHIAFGSIRMEPVFFALGQSAGAAAALAIDSGCAVQDVDYGKLRPLLDAAGQVVEMK